MEQIIPYDETQDSDIFWEEDPYDYLLPKQRGFVTDLVYFSRGMEVPTIFSIWNAFSAIAGAIKRDAWLKWHPKKFYANLYVILIAPPAVAKKSTSISFCEELLTDLHKYIEVPYKRDIKKLKIIRNKITPEAMIQVMEPEKKGGNYIILKDEKGKPLRNADGSNVVYHKTSEVTIFAPELGTLLSKAKYNESLLQNITDLYDPRTIWEYTTKTEGTIRLQRTYVNMLAATTPKGFREGMPQAALGDGFLSRTVLVYQQRSSRIFPQPMETVNGPSLDELKQRLGWIAENAFGEYHFSREAYEAYSKWYVNFKQECWNSPEMAGYMARRDGMILKLSFLLHLQRYSTDKTISVEDFNEAKRIVDETYKLVPRAVQLISSSDWYDKINSVIEYIRKKSLEKKVITRKVLLQHKRLGATEATDIVNQLAQMGEIIIFHKGEIHTQSTRSCDEVYYPRIGGQNKDGEESYRRVAEE